MRSATPLALLVLAVTTAFGEPPPSFSRTLPSFRLVDPLGRTFSDAQLTERGAIVIVTAPTLSQGDAQVAWSDALHALEPGAQGPVRVMLQDMSQSWFRPIVMSKMKEHYRANGPVVLLLDEGGVTRKAFGVGEAVTMGFAIAPGGSVVAVETQVGTPDRAKKLLDAVRAAQPR
ncbi:MAG: hypothetical protein JNJ54_16055 [Myxococcaceae bacterium]|nr:hypothetical protein [Myxococcaceae bacterium]